MTPDIKLLAGPMGGGWAVPLTERGTDVGTYAFDDMPYWLAPIGKLGWIVEPQEAVDRCNEMLAEGAYVQTVSGLILSKPLPC